MQVSPSQKLASQPSLQIQEIEKIPNLLQKQLIRAVVLQKLAPGKFRIQTNTQTLVLDSNVELFPREELLLKPKRDAGRLSLQLEQRVFSLTDKASSESKFSDAYSVKQFVLENPSSLQENGVSGLLKLLDYVFPGFVWQEKTKMYHWQFADSHAEGYYSRKDELSTFLLEYHSQKLGSVSVAFYWQKETMDDLSLHLKFQNFQFYQLALLSQSLLADLLEKLEMQASQITLLYAKPELETMHKKEWLV
ncbi:MAG: hypothetical protein AAF518_03665 [Spirochaetota bacterium]